MPTIFLSKLSHPWHPLLYHALLLFIRTHMKTNSLAVLLVLRVIDPFQCSLLKHPSVSWPTLHTSPCSSEHERARCQSPPLDMAQKCCPAPGAAGINRASGYCSRHQTKHTMHPAQVISTLSLFDATV